MGRRSGERPPALAQFDAPTLNIRQRLDGPERLSYGKATLRKSNYITVSLPRTTLKIPVPMRHRIIQHAGRRFSVKLEDVVWNSLEELAAQSGMRLNQLVAQIASRAGDGANLTGSLRQYCLESALQRIKELERQLEDQRLSRGGVPITLFAEACPAPCLIVDAEHKMMRANAAACEWMGTSEEALIGKSVQHYFQIKSATSLDEIVSQYGASVFSTFSARIVYVRPGRLVVARAKICPGTVRGPGDLAYLILVDTGRAA